MTQRALAEEEALHAMARHILVIDQGHDVDPRYRVRCNGYASGDSPGIRSRFTRRPGWVEHDPEEIWTTVLNTARQALASANLTAAGIAGLGITNQRETVVIWDRRTGRAIHNAIVWQDRRTANVCEHLEKAGHGDLIANRTGLGTRSVFFRDQDCLAARRRRWCPRRRGGRTPRVRHRGQFPAMAPDRGRRTRDRRHQRIAHAAVRHPSWCLG